MKTAVTTAVLFVGFTAAQINNILTFAPTEDSKLRPECVPTQCTNLPATITAADINSCLSSAAPGCQYTGTITSTGTSADLCQQSDATNTNTYVSVTLPTGDLTSIPLEFGPMSGTVTFNTESAALVDCPFYAYPDSSTTCEAAAPTTVPPLGNTAIATMTAQTQAITIDAANLTSPVNTSRLGLTTARPASDCGVTFTNVVFDSFGAPFTVTIPEEIAANTPIDSETYSKFNQAVGSAASCYTPECTFTIVPLTRAQVDACVQSVPADCVFEGISHVVTENADLPCDGSLSTLSENQYVVLDEASYRRLGRGTDVVTGTLTLSMKTLAAVNCPVKTFRVANFDRYNNCGIVEPITPSATAIATLAADSNTVTIDASLANTDGSLGLVISGPPASCGTSSKSLATDVSAPFVYSSQVDGPTTSGASASMVVGVLALASMLVAA